MSALEASTCSEGAEVSDELTSRSTSWSSVDELAAAAAAAAAASQKPHVRAQLFPARVPRTQCCFFFCFKHENIFQLSLHSPPPHVGQNPQVFLPGQW